MATKTIFIDDTLIWCANSIKKVIDYMIADYAPRYNFLIDNYEITKDYPTTNIQKRFQFVYGVSGHNKTTNSSRTRHFFTLTIQILDTGAETNGIVDQTDKTYLMSEIINQLTWGHFQETQEELFTAGITQSRYNVFGLTTFPFTGSQRDNNIYEQTCSYIIYYNPKVIKPN